MLYLIYGCEEEYRGYHGIEEYKIDEFDNFDEAYMAACELAYNVIESFSYTLSYYDEIQEEDGDFDEYIETYVYPIKDTQGHTLKELEQMLYEDGVQEFIDNFRLED